MQQPQPLTLAIEKTRKRNKDEIIKVILVIGATIYSEAESSTPHRDKYIEKLRSTLRISLEKALVDDDE